MVLGVVSTSFGLLLAQDAFPRPASDWLLRRESFEARLETKDFGRELVLENGLVRRRWRLAPNAACVAFDDLMTGASLLRAVEPEARLVLDGTTYDVGGLVGQPNRAYLTEEWIAGLEAAPNAFRFIGIRVQEIAPRMEWKRVRHHAPDAVWPPRGVHVVFDYLPPEKARFLHQSLFVSVHYELYDGLPLFSKWFTLRTHQANSSVELDRFESEILALVEHGNGVETLPVVPMKPPGMLHVETDYSFFSNEVVRWEPDPAFTTQVNYRLQEPCRLVVGPKIGPDVLVSSGNSGEGGIHEPNRPFESFRTFELVLDSTERERRGLARRRMVRTIAPWVTENPLMLHLASSELEAVRTGIDQAAECGFELVSVTFGSGLDMEDERPENLAKFRELAAYAKQRGIELGGYSLLSSRRIAPDSDNCIHVETGEPGGQIFGYAPALASAFGQEYFRKLRRFFEETGFVEFTHDGSYPGDFDAVARPPLQRGYEDSQWVQWRIITDFYRWQRARGVYLEVPDSYFLCGSSKCGMGYRETNWSLPRREQVIHTRQNIYDGTWEKTPSQGWMFVPLTEYHGGGAAATIEPLEEHLDHYERMLASNLGLGVQAVYRGLRLYDTPRVREHVKYWVDWYLRHRDILESDLVHGRRADGRDLDWMLHVNPQLPTKGLLVVYNPLERPLERTLHVDLTYTGTEGTARVRFEDGEPTEMRLLSDRSIDLPVRVPAGGMT